MFFSRDFAVLLVVGVQWFVLSPAAVTAQEASVVDPIASAVERLRIRGAAVLWYDKNQSSEPLMRAFGKVASSDSSDDVTTDTAFMLASVSKVFAGAVVAVLVDKGIVSLDDDICNVLPVVYKGTSACRNYNHPNVPITWRMLVTHRSSLIGDIPTAFDRNGGEVEASYAPNEANPSCPLTDVKGFYRDFLVDKETETSVGSGLGESFNWYELGREEGGAYQDYSPGAELEYSNLAIGYIAALVEHVTGESFEDFFQRNIAAPLGLSNTSWFKTSLPQGARVAVPVEYWGVNDYEDYAEYCFIDYPSGQLYSTVEDLNSFFSYLLDEGASTLWSQQTRQLYLSCQERDVNGNDVDDCEFGLTWELVSDRYRGSSNEDYQWLEAFEQYDWTDGVMHSGSESGVQTQIIVLPKAGVYAAVLTNTDWNSDLAAQTLTAVLADPSFPTSAAPPLRHRTLGSIVYASISHFLL